MFKLWLEAREREVYYHVTYMKNLNGIGRRGLIKSARPNFNARSSLAYHSQNGLFLANKEVKYWIDVYENWANDGSDNILKDGLIPVILRVRAFSDLTKPDQYPGNPAGAWIYPKNIRSEYVEMWTGDTWTNQISKNSLNVKKFVEKESYPGEGYWYNFLPYPYPPDLT
jgi:hypothetical protein